MVLPAPGVLPAPPRQPRGLCPHLCGSYLQGPALCPTPWAPREGLYTICLVTPPVPVASGLPALKLGLSEFQLP